MAFSRMQLTSPCATANSIRGMYGKYVIVSGLYHAPPPHGDFNGYIDNILVLRPLNVANTSK